MGPFDQTARQIAKSNGRGFTAWVLRHGNPPPPLPFARWDDTRRTSWPGGPERTDDLVAILQSPDGAERTWLIVEVKAEPERNALIQVGVYELLLAGEVGEGGQVGSVLLNLTGEGSKDGLHLGVPGLGKGHDVGPLVVNLAEDNAAGTLREIAEGKLELCVLPWLPLLEGGGGPGLIEEWKRIAETEPDVELRVRWRDWALVLAELSKQFVNWQRGLEGWMVKESQVINGWKREGRVEGSLETAREFLLEAIQLQFKTAVPEDIRLAIEGTNDRDMLHRWFRATMTNNTVEQFRTSMRQAP